MRSQMSPRLSTDNLADVDLSHAKNTPNLLLGHPLSAQLPNGQDIFVREFGRIDVFPFGLSVSTGGISRIVGPSAKPQVTGVNADSSIARVQNPQVICGAKMNAIRQHMSTNITSTQEDLSIPVGVDGPSPVPTPIEWWSTRHIPRKNFGFGESRWPDALDGATRVSADAPSSVVRTTKSFCCNSTAAISDGARVLTRGLPSGFQSIGDMFGGLSISLADTHTSIVLQLPGLKPKNFLGAALQRAITESKPDIQKMLMGALTGGTNV